MPALRAPVLKERETGTNIEIDLEGKKQRENERRIEREKNRGNERERLG